MSNIESDIHVALMAHTEQLSGFDMLWPQRGGDAPSGEHVRVNHVPNDNRRIALSGDTSYRMGFLVLTLVSPLGGYEAQTRYKAGQIAEHYSADLQLTEGRASVLIHSVTVKPGRQEDAQWETPIWVDYRCIA